MMSDKLGLLAIRSRENIRSTKVTLELQNHWRMANGKVGIVLRDLALAEIRSNPLLGKRRGWHYNLGQYSGEALYGKITRSTVLMKTCICIFFLF